MTTSGNQRRVSIYIPELSHNNPIPAACRIDNLVYSGGVHGVDPATGKLAATLAEQLTLTFGHIRRIVEAAGGSSDDIIKITVWLADRGDRAALNNEWLKMFPDEKSRPARHVMQSEFDSAMLVQCDFVAVLEK